MTQWRTLFIECQFGWTAVFKDTDDAPEGPVGTLAASLKCHGVIGTYYPQDTPRHHEAVQLRYFEDHETFFLNYGRSVSVTNGDDGWEFDQSERPFIFEQTKRYKSGRIKDRFTPQMLVEYLSHLCIDVVDASKYGPK